MEKRIIIVGAGFAGVSAARTLAKKYKKDLSVKITLIDKRSYMTYMTELHEVAADRVEPEAVKYDLRRIFSKLKNVHLVTDEVTDIDYEKKQVIGQDKNYSYDYLVLALGGQSNDFGIKGVGENAFSLWSIDAAEKLKEHIEKTVRKASGEADEAKRRAMLSFVVSGAGFTGVELVGELAEWMPILAKRYKLDPKEFSLYLVEAMDQILKMVTPKEQTKAWRFMEDKLGIEIITSDGIAEVTSTKAVLNSGRELPSYTTIWTAGVQGNLLAKKWGLKTARGNRVETNQYLQAKEHDDIFIAGDLVSYQDASQDGAYVPQIVQAAEQTGELVGYNISQLLSGGEMKEYTGKYDGFMVSIGSRYSVAYVYDKYHVSGFMATFMKHMSNILYFFSIRSFYNIGAYVRHEFFDMRHQRNLFRGHISHKGNVLWSVPMRLFYGAMWLYEGLTKLFGWHGVHSWFGSDIVFPFPWLKEAVSGASEAATSSASQAAPDPGIFSLNYSYGQQPKLVIEEMPRWFGSIMKFMMPNQDVALFMQKFMTLVEIAIGAALIIGAFVWLTSALTIVLVGMFCLSGMFYWVNMWFIVVALALMGGSGRAFGVDHWLQPWIGKHLDHWIYGKIKCRYNDLQE
ncbi:FAD-dependent oxidoreductase [Aerococcus christensenii]|uniref:FAD-dependent oxidoreductase n=1 Tax=Aerococcus christensenii TaxID=87541 RepID=UPI003F428F34